MKRLLFVLFSVLLCWSLCGCATTYVEEPESLKPRPDLADFPIYDGPKTVVAVLPLGLSERAAKAYPHLLAKDVGLGIHNRVIETLYDTNRFRFVEEKPEVVKDVLDRQWMSMAGMVDQGTAVEMGRMLGARKVIYGEVYDFAQGGENVSGFSAQKNYSTRMGIQIRCVDVETLEYVPGSGTGRGADVGEASEIAIRDAAAGLIRRMK
jgi:curli biogenesis system outer membrane secretion channel CsgG